MANNIHGTKIKDNTCPEEQIMQKSNTDKTSPLERPKGGRWHCSVPHMHVLFEELDQHDVCGSPGVLKKVNGGNMETET